MVGRRILQRRRLGVGLSESWGESKQTSKGEVDP